MTQVITTSLPIDVYNLAKEKRIPWNIALAYGIKAMAEVKLPPMPGESYETPKEQLEKKHKQVEAMQKTILELGDKVEQLENGKKSV